MTLGQYPSVTLADAHVRLPDLSENIVLANPLVATDFSEDPEERNRARAFDWSAGVEQDRRAGTAGGDQPSGVSVRYFLLRGEVGNRLRLPALDPPPPAVRLYQRRDHGLVQIGLHWRRRASVRRDDLLPPALALSVREAGDGLTSTATRRHAVFRSSAARRRRCTA